jgi:hypothetical protein
LVNVKNFDQSTIQTYKYELTNQLLDNDKYTIIYLNDINDVSEFSTDQTLSQAFNVMYPDMLTEHFIYTDSNSSDKIYKLYRILKKKLLPSRMTLSLNRNKYIGGGSVSFALGLLYFIARALGNLVIVIIYIR